jgi:P-type E1-E2 ATPase
MALPRVEPDAFEYTPGRGIVARSDGTEILAGNRALLTAKGITIDAPSSGTGLWGTSEILVARAGRFLGTIYAGDAVRPEAAEAVRTLRLLGIKTVLITGDGRAAGDAVAKELRVDQVATDLLPNQKVDLVQRFVTGGHFVAMVGDGVNDAPALAHATVGVAMGSGTDVARESADIVLLGNDLSKFVRTVRLARRARGIIRFNFAGTLVVDAVGVGLAACGLLNPLLAAFIHVASELTFILNSARLLPGPGPVGALAPAFPLMPREITAA